MGKLARFGILVFLGLVALAQAEEHHADHSVMIKRLINYAGSFMQKSSNEARIFFDDPDLDGLAVVLLGGLLLLGLLAGLPGLLGLLFAPLLLLGGGGGTGLLGNTGTNGLLGTTNLGGLGSTIPVVNVNEVLPGRRRRRSAGMGFPSKLMDRISQNLKNF